MAYRHRLTWQVWTGRSSIRFGGTPHEPSHRAVQSAPSVAALHLHASFLSLARGSMFCIEFHTTRPSPQVLPEKRR